MNHAQHPFDQGTYDPSKGEVKDWTKYTRFAVLNAAGENILFGTKLGGATGFTRIDQTNMDDSGRIPQAQKLIIHGVYVGYFSSALKVNVDILAIAQYLFQTVLEIRINNKPPIFQRRLSEVMNLAHGMIHVPTAAGDNIGRPWDQQAVKAVQRLNKPITLAQGTSFDARLQVGAAPGAAQASDFVDVGLVGELWIQA